MVESVMRREEELFEEKMTMLSWVTANHINGISHRKRPIKMTDLYKPRRNVPDTTEKEKDVEKMKQELRETFGIEG